MNTIIIHNISGVAQTIDDLGLPIAIDETIDLLDYGYTLDEVFSSNDLSSIITEEHVIVNDGISDLSVEDGLRHTNVQSELVDSRDEGLVRPDKWIISANDGNILVDGTGSIMEEA